ncbi:MAG: DUF86 domain-containing protein [Chloroflexi bacterium]|nr:MAG: DUF86 domain-containing protein [Chloroflexota bacterium]
MESSSKTGSRTFSPPALSGRLQRMARFRNMLVHLYWAVDYDRSTRGCCSAPTSVSGRLSKDASASNASGARRAGLAPNFFVRA